jgi:hypothetical protein
MDVFEIVILGLKSDCILEIANCRVQRVCSTWKRGH